MRILNFELANIYEWFHANKLSQNTIFFHPSQKNQIANT